jgi:hypothetical protein
MTAFNPSTDLPAGARACTTVEQLNAWTVEILLANNPTAKFVRTAGASAENRVQYSSGVDADNTQRIQTLVVYEYDSSTAGLSLPDWLKVKELNTAPIPTAFKD